MKTRLRHKDVWDIIIHLTLFFYLSECGGRPGALLSPWFNLTLRGEPSSQREAVSPGDTGWWTHQGQLPNPPLMELGCEVCFGVVAVRVECSFHIYHEMPSDTKNIFHIHNNWKRSNCKTLNTVFWVSKTPKISPFTVRIWSIIIRLSLNYFVPFTCAGSQQKVSLLVCQKS